MTGCKAVNALSKKMIVTSSRDNIKEIVEFSRGQFISHKEEKTSERGVSVLFYPDDKVLETVTFDNNKIESMLQESAFLSKGLAFYYINEIEDIEKTFYSENGLYDYINYLNNGKKFLFEPIHFLAEEGTFQVEVAVGYNEGYNNIVKLYTNNVPQEKGTHLTGFKTAWTSVLNAIAREEKWIKDSESNLTGGDFEEGQILVLNFKMIDPVFKGQNKEELSSTEGRVYVQRLTTQALRDIDKKSLKIIFEKALKAKKAREAAKKAREAVRDNKKNQKVLRFDSKLADCYSKDRLKCEIMITEGDSASGNLKSARDNEFQAVMPIRGKILNTQKASLDKIQKNAEIMTMINAFGLTINPTTMKITYNEEDLRYGKIIIMSDAKKLAV